MRICKWKNKTHTKDDCRNKKNNSTKSKRIPNLDTQKVRGAANLKNKENGRNRYRKYKIILLIIALIKE